MNTEMMSLSSAHWVIVTFREPAPALRLEGRCEDAIGAELFPGGGCTIAVADGVGSAEPERVVECPVDGLGIVAPPVEGFEVGVGLGD